jgi:hypothetical protein
VQQGLRQLFAQLTITSARPRSSASMTVRHIDIRRPDHQTMRLAIDPSLSIQQLAQSSTRTRQGLCSFCPNRGSQSCAARACRSCCVRLGGPCAWHRSQQEASLPSRPENGSTAGNQATPATGGNESTSARASPLPRTHAANPDASSAAPGRRQAREEMLTQRRARVENAMPPQASAAPAATGVRAGRSVGRGTAQRETAPEAAEMAATATQATPGLPRDLPSSPPARLREDWQQDALSEADRCRFCTNRRASDCTSHACGRCCAARGLPCPRHNPGVARLRWNSPDAASASSTLQGTSDMT